MKNILPKILILSIFLCWIACEDLDWDYGELVFIETGMVTETTLTSITIVGTISGLEDAAIKDHGHIYYCTEVVEPAPPVPLLLLGGQVGKTSKGERMESGTIESNFTELTLNTTYYIRAYVVLEDNTVKYGKETKKVELGDNKPTVTTDSIHLFTGGFELYGILAGLQDSVIITRYGFVWSHDNDEPSIDIEADQKIYLGEINRNTEFEKRVENVDALKKYHVRAFAELGKDIFYGETISFFKGDAWVRKADADLAGRGTFFAVIEDVAYVGGGYDAFGNPSYILQKYTAATDTWEMETLEEEKFIGDGVAFGIEDTLYVTTGISGSGVENKELWAYNTVDNMWLKKTPFPGDPGVSLSGSIAKTTTIQGKGYIVTALDGTGEEPIWVYDPQTNSWESFTEPSQEVLKGETIFFSTENELYLGTVSEYDGISSLYNYSIGNEDWDKVSDLPFPEGPWVLTSFCIGHKVYVVTSSPRNNFWEYNTEKNQWTLRADYPNPQKFNPVHFCIDGKGYVGLGYNFSDFSPAADLWEYRPDIEY